MVIGKVCEEEGHCGMMAKLGCSAETKKLSEEDAKRVADFSRFDRAFIVFENPPKEEAKYAVLYKLCTAVDL